MIPPDGARAERKGRFRTPLPKAGAYGTRLIRPAAEDGFKHRAELCFRSEGLVAKLRCPGAGRIQGA